MPNCAKPDEGTRDESNVAAVGQGFLHQMVQRVHLEFLSSNSRGWLN